jgi:hypothetical protein
VGVRRDMESTQQSTTNIAEELITKRTKDLEKQSGLLWETDKSFHTYSGRHLKSTGFGLS